jgi:hypothetical protein
MSGGISAPVGLKSFSTNGVDALGAKAVSRTGSTALGGQGVRRLPRRPRNHLALSGAERSREATAWQVAEIRRVAGGPDIR